MRRIFCLRYAVLTALVVAFLGIAGPPIVYSDRVNAAEKHQSIKGKKRVKHERKKYLKLKPTKKRPRGHKGHFWCFDGDDCD
jgi:hypothetical protein